MMHQCLVCPDYCLCSECKDSDVHKEHNMVGRHSPHEARYPLGMFIEVVYSHDNETARKGNVMLIAMYSQLGN